MTENEAMALLEQLTYEEKLVLKELLDQIEKSRGSAE